MNDSEQRAAAKEFATYWAGKGYEKGESQKFWISLLTDVFGVKNAKEFIIFEEQVRLDHTNFIDATIPTTRVLIEQKGLGKDLMKPKKQSDGKKLNAFDQAQRYITKLALSRHPRWIVTCNFGEFNVYDMEYPDKEPEIILLENLPTEYYRLSFIVDADNVHVQKEAEVSEKAGEIVGILYDAFLKQYGENPGESELKSLNVLCVRLVFCLYAEDAGVFGKHGLFHDYLVAYDAHHTRKALIDLFKILDTKPEDRDKYLEPELAAFPYVNGGLFADENIEVPPFTDEMRDLLLVKASANFDWIEISPTIFGALFESTLNPETRRSGGMHYTTIENIHKVIDPLFLNDLKRELEEICAIRVVKTKEKKLREFQLKLASLNFLDPACGSGNFLTETYLSLRRLENRVLLELAHGQIAWGGDENTNPIMVSIRQFYGIEINDFAVTVAKTALWIAESQMMKETESVILMSLDFLPLKQNAYIFEGNALRMNWNDVIPKYKLNYIFGNPPFIGFTYMSKEQKKDMEIIFPATKNLDYVAAWYKIASEYIQNTRIECGFVSTNSISQGETVGRLWHYLNININYAYRTFVWDKDGDSKKKAHVHCIIIGFATFNRKQKWIFNGDKSELANNISPYLRDEPNIVVESRNKPLCNVSKMIYGNKPADGGNLIINDEDYSKFVQLEPQSQKYIRPLIGAEEYLHGKKRWCLWLTHASPADIRKSPMISMRVKKCKEMREKSIAKGIQKFADTATLFAQITQPEGEDFIVIPRVSSERRKYVPIGFFDANTIVSDAVQIVPRATIYEFGVLTSSVHMAWMRAVCGRLKSDYRYSKDIVYNNFPWPTPNDEQIAKIEQTAQGILEAREMHKECCLADLYDELAMPIELRKAHQQNDKAVMLAYGFSGKDMTENMLVIELLKMYKHLVEHKRL